MRRPRTGTSCEAKELRLLWDAHYLDACNFTADNILLCLTVILIIYFPGLGQTACWPVLVIICTQTTIELEVQFLWRWPCSCCHFKG